MPYFYVQCLQLQHLVELIVNGGIVNVQARHGAPRVKKKLPKSQKKIFHFLTKKKFFFDQKIKKKKFDQKVKTFFLNFLTKKKIFF